jgi:ArsR family transcriptional regulator
LFAPPRSDDGTCNRQIFAIDISANNDILDLVEELVSIARTLADTTRIRIVAALRNGELCVCELVDALDIGQSSLSTHLQMCRQVGVLTARKEGRWIYYSLSTCYAPLIETIFSELQTLRSHEQLRRDAKRLRKRLLMRQGDRCVVGFGQLKREREVLDVVD